MTSVDKDQAKHAIRARVWTLLEQQRAAPPGVHGRIPDFRGAEAAGDRLAALPVWQTARVIKAVPDKAQLPVRARALSEGKLVYMAVPKLAEDKPFYLLDPAELTVPPADAASSRVAASVARKIGVEEMRPVDLIVCGSVAVNRHGVRLGKGAGYSDIEVALLHEAGLIGPQTTIVTTVHSLQVMDEDMPETEHDFSVDLIVTPDEIIECSPPRRPTGLIWEHLSPETIVAIPVLEARAAQLELGTHTTEWFTCPGKRRQRRCGKRARPGRGGFIFGTRQVMPPRRQWRAAGGWGRPAGCPKTT